MDVTHGLTISVAHAARWQLINSAVRLSLQIVVIAILARLLSVTDFGLMGQALVVTGLVSVVAQVGMASAIIQSRELTRSQIETAITISVLSGLFFTVLIWISAPLLGVIYHSDESVSVLRALSPIFTFSSVGATAFAIEQRSLDFSRLVWIDTGAYALGYGGVGIFMAWQGFGVWSLVGAALVEAGVRAVAALRVTDYRPCFPPKLNESRQLIRFGCGMSVTGIVMYAARNLDYLMIGRLLGPAALGFYMRSYQLMMTPLTRFSTVMNMALFRAYSKLQDEPFRLRRALYQNLQLVALAVFPALAVLAALANETVLFALGPNWGDSVAPLRWLCAAGILLSTSDAGEVVIRAKGDVRGRLTRYLIAAPAMALAVSVGAHWGVAGAAAGAVLATALQHLLMAQLVLRLVEGSWLNYFRAQFPGAVAAIGHGALALIVASVLHDQQLSNVIVLVLTVTMCGVSYMLTVFLFEHQLLPSAARQVIDAHWPTVLRRTPLEGNQPP